MLEPRCRRLLLDALRPPEGYAIDRAVGTTYSLDLLALLTAPLAFTLFDADAPVAADGAEPAVDPLALLAALRRHAEQITLFCQAGQISVPVRHKLLFGYLESSVHEVAPPDRHYVFHPKVWLLRFVAEGASVRYRLLCGSRNLTFDHSWDTLLVLEGELRDRTTALSVNHPLGDFLAALPALAIRPVAGEVRAAVDRMQAEVRRVLWESPPELELKAFWPLGLSQARDWPFVGRRDRLLVISPFLSPGCLHRLAEGCSSNVLVSRLESLTPLTTEQLDGFEQVYQLNPYADPEVGADGEQNTDKTDLCGLHAKLYLAKAGSSARLWTGSANATDAAFRGNVEFLVELEGRGAACGIDSFLREGRGCDTFAGLLLEFQPDPTPPSADLLLEGLEQAMATTRTLLACAGIRAVLTSRDEAKTYRLSITRPTEKELPFPEGLQAQCWPINLPEAAARAICPGHVVMAEFERISAEAITSFFAFSLSVQAGPQRATTRFVLNLPLEGAPADRRERILHHLLRDRSQVMRLLRFLLAESGAEANALLRSITAGTSRNGASAGDDPGAEIPLFENLVRTLDRNPAKLDEVARLVEELHKTPEGRDLLPPDFQSIWTPIWEARRRYLA